MKKEHIPVDPQQSFRFFSWENSLDDVRIHQTDGTLAQAPGVGNEWHYHPEIELTLFTEGEGIRYIGDDITSFSSPELVMLGANLPHHWATESSSGYCLQFQFDPTSPLANFYESAGIKSLVKRAKKGLKFSQVCTEDVLEKIELCKHARPIQRLSLFFSILDRLSNARTKTISSFIPQGLSDSKSAVIKKAVKFILAHAADENLELQNVLDHVHMTRATFSRHFQQVLGQSYTQFVQSIRIETARKLLVTSNDSITEIAYAVGFSNLSHFNKVFKKRWSMSPRELKSSLKS